MPFWKIFHRYHFNRKAKKGGNGDEEGSSTVSDLKSSETQLGWTTEGDEGKKRQKSKPPKLPQNNQQQLTVRNQSTLKIHPYLFNYVMNIVFFI